MPPARHALPARKAPQPALTGGCGAKTLHALRQKTLYGVKSIPGFIAMIVAAMSLTALETSSSETTSTGVCM